jgi:hypothetical protein
LVLTVWSSHTSGGWSSLPCWHHIEMSYLKWYH